MSEERSLRTTQLTTATVAALLASVAAGCGGGGSDADASNDPSVDRSVSVDAAPISGNINGATIMDASRNFFAASAVDGTLGVVPGSAAKFILKSDLLKNAKVDSNFNLIVNGRTVGTVMNYPGRGGGTISVFTCTNNQFGVFTTGVRPLLHLSPSASGMIAGIECATNVDKLQTACITITNDRQGIPTFHNTCDYAVAVGWSYVEAPAAAFVPAINGNSSYGSATQVLGMPDGTRQYRYVACRAGMGPVQYLDGINSQAWMGDGVPAQLCTARLGQACF